MRVFLVDDEFLQRALVKKTVDWNSLGMEICGEAEDGEEALKKILEEKPDILIMDINIPYTLSGIVFGRILIHASLTSKNSLNANPTRKLHR